MKKHIIKSGIFFNRAFWTLQHSTKVQIVVFLTIITGVIILYSCQEAPTQVVTGSTTSTIVGTVTYNNQALPGIKVVDVNSATQTTYTTDSTGTFTITLKLTAQYTASLVLSDPSLVYYNDTVSVTLNPGDTKTLPTIALTQKPKTTTSITAVIRDSTQVLPGMKVVDLNSITQNVYTTDSTGSFTLTFKLTAKYTALLMITDPTSAYNSDTVAVAVNPGKDTILSQIYLTKKPKITTTISGSVSYNGQLLSGINIVDINSANGGTAGPTDAYGSFTYTIQLSSQDTARLVLSDPLSVYNPDTISVPLIPGDKKNLGLIILTKNANPKLTATITGTVSDSSQLLAGMNVVDISSANQTVYTTNAYGSFTVTLQLTSTYVAHLVISDPNSIYTNYMDTVTINPGVAMTLPLIVLKKSSKTATTITTITGTVSDSTHQLLSGMKVVDINSVNQTTKITDAFGSFTDTLKLTAPYTAKFVISDPNLLYNNDTVLVTVNPGEAKTIATQILSLSKNFSNTTTIIGSVSDSSQYLSGMKVVDITSANQTVYTTDVNGIFTVTLKLASAYTAHLVISDPSSVYNSAAVAVPVNPGDTKTLPRIILTKNTNPKVATTLSGTVSFNGQLLSGMKVVDINSANPTAYYTSTSGYFSISLQLSSLYTARLVVTDPTATYNPDTTALIILNPGDAKTVPITLTKNASAIRTANQVSVIGMSTNHIYSKGVGLLEGNSQLENCQYIMQVKDSAGNAIAGSPTYKAKFSLLFYPADGAYGTLPSCNPDSSTTDENGQLTVSVASGTCPGTVQLVVQVLLGNGSTINYTYITRLIIYSGFADQSHFSLGPTETYPNGWVIPYWGVYQTHNYSASVADTFGYAVPSGHAVDFIATPGGDGKIGNNGIVVTDLNGEAGVAYIATYPSPSDPSRPDVGYYTTTDPLTSGRKGYMWLQAQTMGKNGTPIRDSILILWNEGAMIPNQPAAISMANHSHSGIIDTLTLWDSNGNPINGTITATVDLGSNPVQGESFEVEGDIGATAVTIPKGDYRLLGEGNTKFAFGVYDNSSASITTAGSAVTVDITITSANYASGIVVYVPVTVH